MADNCPFDIKNVAMDGTWKKIKIEPKWNAVLLGMDDDVTEFSIRNPAKPGAVRRFPSKGSFTFGSFNFTDAEFVEVMAPGGTLQVVGFTRGT